MQPLKKNLRAMIIIYEKDSYEPMIERLNDITSSIEGIFTGVDVDDASTAYHNWRRRNP
jgi:hypothetical protein